MRPAEIAALPKTDALLFTTGRRPLRLSLSPWYNEDQAPEIEDRSVAALQEVRQAAIEHLGPTNPVARAIASEQHESIDIRDEKSDYVG